MVTLIERVKQIGKEQICVDKKQAKSNSTSQIILNPVLDTFTTGFAQQGTTSNNK
jgi:hypothetical protein